MAIPSREVAWALLSEYTKNESLLRHALSVEAAMRFYAAQLGADGARWGALGLLHDLDYDQYPSLEDHPFRGAEILRSRGVDDDFVNAILSHAEHTGVPRDTLERKVLFAVDELCGFVTAVALVRPSKRLSDVEPQSVRKKMKDKAFARNVSRDDIVNGARLLEMDMDAHIGNVITAMRGISGSLGL